MHCSLILGLSITDRKVTEAQVKPRDSTKHIEGYTLRTPLPSGQEITLRGDRWTTRVTREALQSHLRAICYRQKSDRGTRQA